MKSPSIASRDKLGHRHRVGIVLQPRSQHTAEGVLRIESPLSHPRSPDTSWPWRGIWKLEALVMYASGPLGRRGNFDGTSPWPALKGASPRNIFDGVPLGPSPSERGSREVGFGRSRSRSGRITTSAAAGPGDKYELGKTVMPPRHRISARFGVPSGSSPGHADGGAEK
jgi:hypothetical protein